MYKRAALGLIPLIFLNGSAFADAPVATLNTDGGQQFAAATITAPLSTNTAPTADAGTNTPVATPNVNTPDAAAPATQVANTNQAMLATLTPDQRIARLENQVQYLYTYTNQLNALSAQVDVLRGQVEDLNHQVTELQKQLNQTSSSQNIANSAQAEASSAASAASPSNSNAAPALPTQAEQNAYQAAYKLMAGKQYTAAVKGFNNFLTKYPNSSFAPNAHYWLGELYLAEGQPDNASQQYRAVVSNQNAAKRPDAMVKLGTILLAYGDSAHAKELFTNVIKQYPGTPAANQAKLRLQNM